jgi:glycyl-tRNA synthetase beta chain
LRIIIERDIDLDLTQAISSAASQFADLSGAKLSGDELCEQVLTYILERFRSWYREEGIGSAVFAAVSALGLSNPLDINARVQAVQHFSQLPEAVALAAANKRVSNILAKQLGDSIPAAIDTNLLQEDAEQHLAAEIERLASTVAPLFGRRDYSGVLTQLAKLREPVDRFFDEVMVMAEDAQVRNNRLALLHSLRQLFINVADISQLAPAK